MKIAIVHEMLIKLWGAERVLQELIEMYPGADVFTLMYDEKKVSSIFPKNRVWYNTPAQTVFDVSGKPRLALPLMPMSVRKINLDGYDLVISSSSWFAHGVTVPPGVKHICYCHSPARYLWDATDEVQKEIGVQGGGDDILSKIKISVWWPLVKKLFSQLRSWDTKVAQTQKLYIANSGEVQKRITAYYHRDSVVLWPPVDTGRFSSGPIRISQRNYFVVTSALTPFKQVDRVIRVMNKLSINLKIIGDGAQRAELQKLAWKTIEFLGRISDEEVARVYMNARWFLMPQKEDAGIAPLEAMAAGVPVFWLAQWGLLETNIDGVTGRFFHEETDENFEKLFLEFDHEIGDGTYDDAVPLTTQTGRFNSEHFRKGFQEIVEHYQTV